MAEEEILTEHVVAPKKAKDGSGGSPMIIIAVVLVGLAGVAFFLKGQMGGVTKTVQEGVDKVTQEQQRTRNKLAGKLEIKECSEKSEPKGKVHLLTSPDGKESEAIILNLADGHYIRTKITICADPEVTDEDILAQKDALVWAVTEVFNRKTVDDIITIKGAKADAAEPKTAGEGELASDEDFNMDESAMPVAKGSKLNALRSDIMSSFSSFGSLKISDVYLPELVVDVQ